MSREIKFRAWDDENYEMIHGVGITPDGIAYSIPDGADMYDQFEYYPDAKIMQYTGLRANGVGIYEGDIVEWQDHKPSRQVHEVRWSNRSLWWSLYKNDTFYESLSRADIPRVIGNIYENPELLEDDNE